MIAAILDGAAIWESASPKAGTPTRTTEKSQPAKAFTYQRAAIVARIVARLHASPHFSTTQLAKGFYVIPTHVGLDLGVDFHRMPAGPLWKGMYRLLGFAHKQHWIDFTKAKTKGTKDEYSPGPKIDDRIGASRFLLGEREAEFDRLLDLFGEMDTEQAEIWATAYAVWNDFLLDGKSPTDKEIIHDFRTNWHPKKKPFPPDRIQTCLNWMRMKDLTPSGTGRRTLRE